MVLSYLVLAVAVISGRGLTEWLRLEGSSEGHLAQPSLLKQGHLEPLAQDHVLLNISKDRDSMDSVQPVPALSDPHSTTAAPYAQTAPPVFHFMPIASGPVTRHL